MSYGFAFNKSSHQEQRPQAGGAASASASWLGGSAATSVFAVSKEPEKKSTAERQADVVEYLKGRLQTGRGPATITEISDATEVELRKGRDDAVLEMIMANPKVESLNDDDPLQETAFVYVAKYAVSNQRELLQLVNRCKGGICQEELKDTYKDVENDMAAMREDGRIIAVLNKETNKINLYPRGDVFLTQLPGKVKIAANSAVALTQEDMSRHIRRGEALRLGEKWFRVSSEVMGSQTQRSKAPLSVTMDQDLSSSNVYKYEMGAPASAEGKEGGGDGSRHQQQQWSHTDRSKAELQYPLPASREYDGAEIFEGRAARHGCCMALRELWRKTAEEVPKDPIELHQVMFKKGLTTSKEGAPQKKPKRKAPDGSVAREQRALKRALKRKHKARAFKTVTNTHLEGTALGKLLEGGGQGSGGGDRGGL